MKQPKKTTHSQQNPNPLPKKGELTKRQQEVLEWVAKGKSTQEIGDALGISPKTVKKHLQYIFAELGVRTRIGAIMAYKQQSSAIVPRQKAKGSSWRKRREKTSSKQVSLQPIHSAEQWDNPLFR